MLRMIGTIVKTAKVIRRERSYGFARSENGISIGMISPESRAVELEHQIVGGVFDRAYLLENYLAFHLEVGCAKERTEDQIGENVSSNLTVLIQHSCLIRCVLARSVGIERTAHRFE